MVKYLDLVRVRVLRPIQQQWSYWDMSKACVAGVQFPAWPQVGKLVVACRWSAVYSTEP